jgi:hypothetical protein
VVGDAEPTSDLRALKGSRWRGGASEGRPAAGGHVRGETGGGGAPLEGRPGDGGARIEGRPVASMVGRGGGRPVDGDVRFFSGPDQNFPVLGVRWRMRDIIRAMATRVHTNILSKENRLDP